MGGHCTPEIIYGRVTRARMVPMSIWSRRPLLVYGINRAAQYLAVTSIQHQGVGSAETQATQKMPFHAILLEMS